MMSNKSGLLSDEVSDGMKTLIEMSMIHSEKLGQRQKAKDIKGFLDTLTDNMNNVEMTDLEFRDLAKSILTRVNGLL